MNYSLSILLHGFTIIYENPIKYEIKYLKMRFKENRYVICMELDYFLIKFVQAQLVKLISSINN